MAMALGQCRLCRLLLYHYASEYLACISGNNLLGDVLVCLLCLCNDSSRSCLAYRYKAPREIDKDVAEYKLVLIDVCCHSKLRNRIVSLSDIALRDVGW